MTLSYALLRIALVLKAGHPSFLLEGNSRLEGRFA